MHSPKGSLGFVENFPARRSMKAVVPYIPAALALALAFLAFLVFAPLALRLFAIAILSPLSP